MTKAHEYQRFKLALRDLSDRPSLVQPLFDRGLSIEDAKQELAQIEGNGFTMFKRAARGGADIATKRIDRIMTIDGARRKLAQGALDSLCGLRGRRMTDDAAVWIEEQIENLLRSLQNSA